MGLAGPCQLLKVVSDMLLKVGGVIHTTWKVGGFAPTPMPPASAADANNTIQLMTLQYLASRHSGSRNLNRPEFLTLCRL